MRLPKQRRTTRKRKTLDARFTKRTRAISLTSTLSFYCCVWCICVTLDISADRPSLLGQTRVLSKLMKDVGLRPPDESAASVYTDLSPEHLAFVRRQAAQRLERRFSDATAAVRRHGRSSAEARQGWGGFQKELRHLTTLTLLMTGRLSRP